MTDWNKVAATLSFNIHTACEDGCGHDVAIRSAISLCQRMAKGELVERPTPPSAGNHHPACSVCGRLTGGCCTVPAPVCPDEREHCWQVAQAECVVLDGDLLLRIGPSDLQELLMRERAAVRAEYEATHRELRKAWDSASAQRDALSAEVERLRSELAQAQLRVARLEHDLEDLESEYEDYRIGSAYLTVGQGGRHARERFMKMRAERDAANAELERLRARVQELEYEIDLALGDWNDVKVRDRLREVCSGGK